jgi:hypothetical protein
MKIGIIGAGQTVCLSETPGSSEDEPMPETIEVGYETFVSDGDVAFGAVRQVAPRGRPELVIYVENAGDFVVPLAAVDAVHAQKVILNCGKLDRDLRMAIGHAHDAEEPDA